MSEYITLEQAEEAVWEVLDGMGINPKYNESTVSEVVGILSEIPSVTEMIDMDSYRMLQADLHDCRNELCLKCEAYQYNYKTHECDGCRWKH